MFFHRIWIDFGSILGSFFNGFPMIRASTFRECFWTEFSTKKRVLGSFCFYEIELLCEKNNEFTASTWMSRGAVFYDSVLTNSFKRNNGNQKGAKAPRRCFCIKFEYILKKKGTRKEPRQPGDNFCIKFEYTLNKKGARRSQGSQETILFQI